MAVKCPTCLTEVDDSHAVGIAMQIEKSTSWDSLAHAGKYNKAVNVTGLGPAFVLALSVPDDDWEGQGVEPECFMIIDLAGRLFRKNGTASSYGEPSWHGAFIEVKAQTAPVTEWVGK